MVYIKPCAAELMLDRIGLRRTFDDGQWPPSYPIGKGLNLQIKVRSVGSLVMRFGTAAQPLVLLLKDRGHHVTDHGVGQRQFGVADPDGYLLGFPKDLGCRPVTK